MNQFNNTRFVGFSTQEKFYSWHQLENQALALRDLKNEFYTRRGERVGRPEFGSILPELVFEQLDDMTVDEVQDEVVRIIGNDIRWELLSINVDVGEHSIDVAAQIRYLPTVRVEELFLRYSAREETTL